VKDVLLKLLTVMLLLLVGMHWQKLFMLGCLIGRLIFTSLHYQEPFLLFMLNLFFDSVYFTNFVISFRLVDKINRSVGQDLNSRVQIGVLDIYGFECFKNNR
jgi:hypothetical protein